jgi:hypothetical protein
MCIEWITIENVYKLFRFDACCLQDVKSQSDLLCPILHVLVKCVCCCCPMRKFLRQHVLPPLTEVHSRPEEGTTLRNKLCRLLTTSVTLVRDLVEEFLFVLCKENGESNDHYINEIQGHSLTVSGIMDDF